MFSVLSDDSKLGKAVALAQAGINISQGITKALAQGGILGIGMGAIVAAAGAIQIKKIASAKTLGGGGGPGDIGGTFQSPSGQAGSTQGQPQGSALLDRISLTALSALGVGQQAQNDTNSAIQSAGRAVVQVAVVDINNAQNARSVKVDEASLRG